VEQSKRKKRATGETGKKASAPKTANKDIAEKSSGKKPLKTADKAADKTADKTAGKKSGRPVGRPRKDPESPKSPKNKKNSKSLRASKTSKTSKNPKTPKALKHIDTQVFLALSLEGSHRDGWFCLGIAQILEGIDELGALMASSRRMGLAYSKAWTILGNCEDALGRALINRAGARGSSLTPDGKKLLEAYKTLKKEIDAFAVKRFAELIK
jgi:molybdate transport system regulatory protein